MNRRQPCYYKMKLPQRPQRNAEESDFTRITSWLLGMHM